MPNAQATRCMMMQHRRGGTAGPARTQLVMGVRAVDQALHAAIGVLGAWKNSSPLTKEEKTFMHINIYNIILYISWINKTNMYFKI